MSIHEHQIQIVFVHVRYPDDPFDRVWESDQVKRPNFLVGVAPGTDKISTKKNIEVNNREYPPVKVMQTAVVGTEGNLSYRLTLMAPTNFMNQAT